MESFCIIHLPTAQVHVIHKPIRNMNLRVYRTDGSVRLSVPLGTSMEVVRQFVESRQDWIARQLTRVEAAIVPIPEGFVRHLGELVPMEALCGKIPERGQVAVLQAMQRRVLAELLQKYLDVWQEKLGLTFASWKVRRMKSRWGSCHPQKRVLCFNADLVYYAPECCEYVVVHELLHLRIAGHGPAFWKLVSEAMPDWKDRRAKLRRHEPSN